MKILILGLNYAPEPVGIGPYTTGLAEALAAAGHAVEVVSAKPYYPGWRKDPAFARPLYPRRMEAGVRIVRCPIYVPARPSGVRRLIHHVSYAIAAAPAMLAALLRRRPDVVIAVAPSLIAAPVAWAAAKLARARLWIHVQDFEVEAAFATGLINESGRVARLARTFEDGILKGGDVVSSISPQMCRRLASKGVASERIVELRNWAETESPRTAEPFDYRAAWGLGNAAIALYSGNIANKQGIEIIVDAARRLAHRDDIVFVICGEGPNLPRLQELAADLGNVRFRPLQPAGRFHQLLAAATVHLLPQLAGAADLVLPSKLANMLASGRPVVATADAGTGIAREVEGCGLVVAPGDGEALAEAVARIADDPALAARLGTAGRARAEERWSRRQILGRAVAAIEGAAAHEGGVRASGSDPRTRR